MTLLLIALGLLPSFAWLIFYLREDLHPEPKRLILLTFIVGGLFAFIALIFQNIFSCLYVSALGLRCSRELTSGLITTVPAFIVTFASFEEVVKFAAAYIVVRRSRFFDEPVDAMIYTTTAALGFAAVENLGAVFQASSTAFIGGVLTLIILRLVGATLLHTISSATAGYYWSLSIREFGAKKFIFWGLIIATTLHALFNYLILKFGRVTYAIVFLIIAAFFVLNDFEKLKRRKL